MRGTLFLLGEIAFVTLNVVGYVLLSAQRADTMGGVRDLQRAETARALMNVGFFGLIGTCALGVVDGALERGPP